MAGLHKPMFLMTCLWPVVKVFSLTPLNVYYCLEDSQELMCFTINRGQERELPLGTPSWYDTKLKFHLVVRENVLIESDTGVPSYMFEVRKCHSSIHEVSISLLSGRPVVTCGSQLCKRVRSRIRRQFRATSSSE